MYLKDRAYSFDGLGAAKSSGANENIPSRLRYGYGHEKGLAEAYVCALLLAAIPLELYCMLLSVYGTSLLHMVLLYIGSISPTSNPSPFFIITRERESESKKQESTCSIHDQSTSVGVRA